MDKEEIIKRIKRVDGLGGMTLNERLFATGLLDTFDVAKMKDKELAKTILQAVGVDETSIKRILHF
jgi:hypothetical protein